MAVFWQPITGGMINFSFANWSSHSFEYEGKTLNAPYLVVVNSLFLQISLQIMLLGHISFKY